jgi:hypothetical protein
VGKQFGAKIPDRASRYAGAFVDADGNILDGAKN